MRHPELLLDTSFSDQSICIGVSLGLHLLLLLWNPMMLRGNWEPPHNPLVSIDIVVDTPGVGGAAAEPPKKMSLMETLSDMLMKPKMEQIATRAAAPAVQAPAPILQDRSRMTAMQFQPKSQAEELASMMSKNQIDIKKANMAATPNSPTLQSKSFGGIRTKDLPFQVGTDQSIAAGGPSVPIAVGTRSAKDSLSYTGPTLTEKSGVVPRGIRVPSTSVGNMSAIGTGAPATIQVPGSGGISNAPTSAPSLQERGGGTVSRTLFQSRGQGSNIGSGIEGIPSAAADLDRQLSSGSESRNKKPKGVELEGPIGNRGIVKKVIPQYPAWAEEQGIIGSVRIYFTVAADGAVRSNIRVTKTTGYPQLDQLGIDAIKQWRFAPAPATTDEGSQWGIITFNFSLSS